MQKQTLQDLTLRQQVSGNVIALLSRAEGLDLMQYGEGLRENVRVVPVGDDSNKVGEALAEGFSLDRITVEHDIVLKRLDGLDYPVRGYPEVYDTGAYDDDDVSRMDKREFDRFRLFARKA